MLTNIIGGYYLQRVCSGVLVNGLDPAKGQLVLCLITGNGKKWEGTVVRYFYFKKHWNGILREKNQNFVNIALILNYVFGSLIFFSVLWSLRDKECCLFLCICLCVSQFMLVLPSGFGCFFWSLALSVSLSHTHAHTYTLILWCLISVPNIPLSIPNHCTCSPNQS